jgi:hypothetical protein
MAIRIVVIRIMVITIVVIRIVLIRIVAMGLWMIGHRLALSARAEVRQRAGKGSRP